MNEHRATIGDLEIGGGRPLTLIAGPCVIEDERTLLATAERLARISDDYNLPLIFKSSYEKDNRSLVTGYRGMERDQGLRLLSKVRETTGLKVLSDIHRERDVAACAEQLDIVQIPAFLCQQTSLLIAAGQHARAVNIKKGQFMAPETMDGPVGKVQSGGCQEILLTERGSCFGYNRLVSDITGIPIMQGLGCPVVFDATHIVRRYGIPSGKAEGGQPEFIAVLAKSGVAAGADVLFIETHPNPSEALCDAASMLPLNKLPELLEQVLPIAEAVRKISPDKWGEEETR